MAIDVESTYLRYGPMVLRRCQRLLVDKEKALDAMHDVFVNLLTHQDRLDDRALSSLLHRIATNVCLNRIRHQRRRPEDGAGDMIQRIARVPGMESRAQARSVLGKLFKKERESTAVMAVMHLLDGMTLEEVALEVGLSVSGVRKRLRRLRTHLRELQEV